MWKRFWKIVATAWGLYRQGTALKGLLQSLGLWKYVALAGAAVLSVMYAMWSGLTPVLQVLVGVVGFAALLLVAGFGVILVRVWKQPTRSASDPGAASASTFHGAAEHKLIKAPSGPLLQYVEIPLEDKWKFEREMSLCGLLSLVIKNGQTAIPETAINVCAAITYRHVDGRKIVVTDKAQWLNSYKRQWQTRPVNAA